MRDETAAWLEPMLNEARRRDDIDVNPLIYQASMPAAEADDQFLDWMAKNSPAGVDSRGLDWVRFGQLLRRILGWDDTYPAYPDFPEAQDVP